MGKELYAASPVFARALDEACEALDQHLEAPLKELLFAQEGSKQAALLDQHRPSPSRPSSRPRSALFRLTRGPGPHTRLPRRALDRRDRRRPRRRRLSLHDAAKLVAPGARLMGALPEGGAMVAIEATEEEVKEAIAGKEAELSIAAVNGPTSIVVSGQEQAALRSAPHFEGLGKRTKRLAVSHAFHSPLMEPMLEDFAEVAKSLDYHEPRIPVLSNLSGEILTKEQATDPAYWVSHVRGAVRFADMVATLEAQGATTLIELGPDAVLTAMAATRCPRAQKPRRSRPCARAAPSQRPCSPPWPRPTSPGQSPSSKALPRRQARPASHLPLPERALLDLRRPGADRCQLDRPDGARPPPARRRDRGPRRPSGSPSPGGSPWPPTHGSQTTPSSTPRSCPAPPSSSWR